MQKGKNQSAKLSIWLLVILYNEAFQTFHDHIIEFHECIHSNSHRMKNVECVRPSVFKSEGRFYVWGFPNENKVRDQDRLVTLTATLQTRPGLMVQFPLQLTDILVTSHWAVPMQLMSNSELTFHPESRGGEERWGDWVDRISFTILL